MFGDPCYRCSEPAAQRNQGNTGAGLGSVLCVHEFPLISPLAQNAEGVALPPQYVGHLEGCLSREKGWQTRFRQKSVPLDRKAAPPTPGFLFSPAFPPNLQNAMFIFCSLERVTAISTIVQFCCYFSFDDLQYPISTVYPRGCVCKCVCVRTHRFAEWQKLSMLRFPLLGCFCVALVNCHHSIHYCMALCSFSCLGGGEEVWPASPPHTVITTFKAASSCI